MTLSRGSSRSGATSRKSSARRGFDLDQGRSSPGASPRLSGRGRRAKGGSGRRSSDARRGRRSGPSATVIAEILDSATRRPPVPLDRIACRSSSPFARPRASRASGRSGRTPRPPPGTYRARRSSSSIAPGARITSARCSVQYSHTRNEPDPVQRGRVARLRCSFKASARPSPRLWVSPSLATSPQSCPWREPPFGVLDRTEIPQSSSPESTPSPPD